jgi:hypothetical protein
MAVFTIPLAGIVIAVFLGDSITDQTLYWLALFFISLALLLSAEIRSYLNLHSSYRQARAHEREAMAELLKDRLGKSDTVSSAAVNEDRLAEQMVNEIKMRISKKKAAA